MVAWERRTPIRQQALQLGPINVGRDTPDLLAKEGYRYVPDWAHDDQPTRLETENSGLLSIPYSQEINDLPAIIERKQEADTFAAMIRAAVDQLLSECERRPVVLGIALHPYIMSQAHRVPALARVLTELREADDPRIWWTTAGGIAAHVEADGLAARLLSRPRGRAARGPRRRASPPAPPPPHPAPPR